MNLTYNKDLLRVIVATLFATLAIVGFDSITPAFGADEKEAAAAKTEKPKAFKPSERVPVDWAIDFPTDI